MSDENAKNIEATEIEPNQKTELIDSPLLKGIIVSASVYLISYSVLSIVFGNTFAAFLATPLTGASYLLLARWDRLRDSREISLQNIRLIFVEIKISLWTILFGIFVIGIVQALASIPIIFFIGMFDPTFCDACDAGYLAVMDQLTDTWIGMIGIFFSFYISFLLGGYFSAKSAIRKNLAPYKHAVLSALAFTFLSFALTILLNFIDKGKSFLSSEDEDISVGAKVLLFSQFILLPLIGANILVRKFKAKEIEKAKKAEDDKKHKEDWANRVASEKERLKTETGDKKKRKTDTNKSKKKVP